MTTPRAAAPFELLSIVFPMWNEEEYVGRAIHAAREACATLLEAGQIKDYEIVVVDDCSTDATGKIADALAAEDPHIVCVHHASNRKLGGSIKSGFAAAKGDLVLYTDADLPFDLIELSRAVRAMRVYEADIVSAYRLDRTSEGPRRAVYSFAYNALVRYAFGTRVRDVNFAFKLIRRRVLDNITLVSEGSFIDAELMIRATRMGFTVVQIGVDYFHRTRGVSSLSSLPVIRQMVMEMVRLRGSLKDLRPVPPS